jgi:uncharacterized protein YifN (PemK superfamily)
MDFKRWEVVIVEFGTPNTQLNKDSYKVTEIINEMHGINLGKEFSCKHYGIIISPTYLNKQKVVILPISSKRDKYKCEFDNIYCLKTEKDFQKSREKYKFLSKPSIVLINDIRSLDITRINKFIDKQGNIKEFFLEKKDQEGIKYKLKKFFIE